MSRVSLGTLFAPWPVFGGSAQGGRVRVLAFHFVSSASPCLSVDPPRYNKHFSGRPTAPFNRTTICSESTRWGAASTTYCKLHNPRRPPPPPSPSPSLTPPPPPNTPTHPPRRTPVDHRPPSPPPPHQPIASTPNTTSTFSGSFPPPPHPPHTLRPRS